MPLSHDGPKSLAANLQFAFFNFHFAMHCEFPSGRSLTHPLMQMARP
jgi:hypothetical protein